MLDSNPGLSDFKAVFFPSLRKRGRGAVHQLDWILLDSNQLFSSLLSTEYSLSPSLFAKWVMHESLGKAMWTIFIGITSLEWNGLVMGQRRAVSPVRGPENALFFGWKGGVMGLEGEVGKRCQIRRGEKCRKITRDQEWEPSVLKHAGWLLTVSQRESRKKIQGERG